MNRDPSHPAADLEALAAKHGVGVEAVRHMLRALEAGGGTMAQFDHPEFGGMGQWFAGGMVMVGRLNDHALKARVSALCEDIAASLRAQSSQTRTASASRSQSQSSSSSGGFAASSGAWWPDGLGRPSSVGAQNATRYAYFPESRRLAVEANGHVALYDTGDHVITGASQQQGGASSFVFSGPGGTVSLGALKRVDIGEADASGGSLDRVEETSRPAAATPAAAASDRAPPSARGGHAQVDVLSTLERLAELHRKGVLTDAEFSGKKADLLARL